MRKREQEMETPAAELPVPAHPQVPVRLVPTHTWRQHWLTAGEFAKLMNRHEQTVYSWLRNGTLAEFGIPVYQCRRGRLHSGRTFICNIY